METGIFKNILLYPSHFVTISSLEVILNLIIKSFRNLISKGKLLMNSLCICPEDLNINDISLFVGEKEIFSRKFNYKSYKIYVVIKHKEKEIGYPSLSSPLVLS